MLKRSPIAYCLNFSPEYMCKRKRSGNNTIKYHTWPRTSYGKVTKAQENTSYKRAKMPALSQEVITRLQPTSPLVLMWIKTHRCLVCMKDMKLIHELSPRNYKSGYKTEIKQRYRVWTLTHLHAIKEESKVTNCDWVDHQACNFLKIWVSHFL